MDVCKSTQCFKFLHCVDIFCSQVHTLYVTQKHTHARRCVAKLKLIVYHPTQEFHQPISISRNPLLYRILAGQSSSGKLGGREVKTSALVIRKSWVRILPGSPVKFFHRHSESTEYAALYTCRCRQNKINCDARISSTYTLLTS